MMDQTLGSLTALSEGKIVIPKLMKRDAALTTNKKIKKIKIEI